MVLNEKLLEVLGDDVTQDQAFAHANDVLKNAVGGISDIIHIPGLVNVDFEDVKTVMSEPGKAMMGTATRRRPGPRHARRPKQAVACPLLEGIDLSGARGVLVLIAANRSTFKLAESRNAMNTHPPLRRRRCARDLRHGLRRSAGRPAARDRDRHRPEPARGARCSRRCRWCNNVPVQRTGTDNLPVLQPAGADAARRSHARLRAA